jgi:hypothetical protein
VVAINLHAEFRIKASHLVSVMQTDLKNCPQCHAALIEIDHYGERLVGCMDCNKWSWRGSQRLLLELPDDDIDALRERVRRAKQAG